MIKTKFKRKIFVVAALLAILLTGMTTVNNSAMSSEAGIICKQMGSGMRPIREVPLSNVPQKEKPHRKWTAEELFSSAVRFTTYFGEGEGSAFLYEDKVDRSFGRGDIYDKLSDDKDVNERLEENQKDIRCVTAGITNILPNFMITITKMITSFIGIVLGVVLGDNTLASTLVGIVGGTGSNGGLIGNFLYGLYMPFLILAGLTVAITLIYKGIVKRKIRESFMNIAWSFGAVIVGLAFMLNPQILAEAPQTITSQITTCVLGALSGQNCLTGKVKTPAPLSGIECQSSVEDKGSKTNADMLVNSMSCTIWKTFVLEEWALEQFGEPYSNLYTHNVPKGGKLWEALPEGKGERYCVTMGSSKSAEEYGVDTITGKEKQVILDEGDQVCNVALYQLYIKTRAHDVVNHKNDEFAISASTGGKTKYDARWFDIILPMAKEGTNWSQWSGSWRSLGRIASSFMSLIAVSFAGYILIPLGILGGVYNIAGIVLMAFAPLFLLLAIEPTRGRKMFLGWVESIISSVLKYFAIAMMIVVALTMYSAVLNSVTGPMAFISVIIMSFLFRSYRKEILDIIGAANLGGKRVSNKIQGAYDKTKKTAKKYGGAAIGGAAGAVVANRAQRKERISSRKASIDRLNEELRNATNDVDRELYQELLNEEEKKLAFDESSEGRKADRNKAITSGAEASTKRIARRGTSFTASTFSQMSRTERELKKDEDKRLAERQKEEKELREKLQIEKDHEIDKAKYGDMSSIDDIDIEVQREDIGRYKGELTHDDVVALDNFAEQIVKVANKDLYKAAEGGIEDENQKMIIANEINARIKAKSLKGERVGRLARTELANKEYVPVKERELTIKILEDNYLEGNSKEDRAAYVKELDIDSYKDGPEKERLKERLFETDMAAKANSENDEKYIRKTPTFEELEANPDKYLKAKDLATPDALKNAIKEKAKEQEVEKDNNNSVEKQSGGLPKFEENNENDNDDKSESDEDLYGGTSLY